MPRMEPVVDRLLKRYKAVQGIDLKEAQGPRATKTAEQEAQNEINALILFKRDWAFSCGCIPSCRKSSTTATPTSRNAPSSSSA
jgi:hypothetical protein